MRRILVASALLGVAVLMVVVALDFGPEARRLPLVVGLPLIVMALINLGAEIRSHLAESAPQPGSETTAIDESGHRLPTLGSTSGQAIGALPTMETEAEARPERSWSSAIGYLAAVVLIFRYLGQFLAAPIVVVLLMRTLGKEPWKNVLISVVFLTATLYVLINFLGVQAYPGVIPRSQGWW